MAGVGTGRHGPPHPLFMVVLHKDVYLVDKI